MITEDELTDLLQRAGEAFSVPADGPSAIRAAARRSATLTTRRMTTLRRREWAFAGVAVAAIGALTGVLLTVGGAAVPAPIAQPANGAASLGVRAPATVSHGAASPPKASVTPISSFSSRDVVVTGTMRLSVRRARLSSSVDTLESLAGAFDGYVGRSDVVESGRQMGGSLVLDVPARSFQSLIDRARRSGAVRSLTTSNQDVTGQVVDLGARLTALEDERAQLEVLLSKSAKVSDLLQVEDQIGSVQSEIEQIQGQERVLSQQVAFSALTVQLAVRTVVHHKVSLSGFSHAWHVATSSFVGAVKDFVSVLGDLAFAILAALVALALAYASWRKGWPILRRRFV
jgi:Domain of unknown function (DUF4349)